MKADFEKGTKVCSKCKRELPISEFCKHKRSSDGLQNYCKRCTTEYHKSEKMKHHKKERADKFKNTFGRSGIKRGQSTIMKRDYELTKGQLERRNVARSYGHYKSKKETAQGVLVWYDNRLNDLNNHEYCKVFQKEYAAQRNCAIRGYVGRVKPSEHFLFDFDLEQMLKDNVYYTCCGGKKRYYITKWWDGEIRHWTVNDGIWRK